MQQNPKLKKKTYEWESCVLMYQRQYLTLPNINCNLTQSNQLSSTDLTNIIADYISFI